MMMLDFKRDLTWYVRSDVLPVDVTRQDASALSVIRRQSCRIAGDHALLEVTRYKMLRHGGS